ncbi:MAG TPA: GGDEF domain-containing protein [Frateuria sp.]|uniref:GGDEF domain-containing protein n=1 Tax=Frateuria sp. TaxID=2211372 RepID=UPI002D802C3F|nr:GGDEF domain-containing protein [Frateuria sp.]HET6807041.1 GGDEF domain-containing protein [Frateuria sp.]
MKPLGWWRLPVLFAGTLCATIAVAATTPAATPPGHLGNSADRMLLQADGLATTNQSAYVPLLKRLDGLRPGLSPEQRLHLDYLQGWQLAYEGHYEDAGRRLRAVLDSSGDATLRLRAGATLINMLGISSRYQEAFSRLSDLLNDLPKVSDHAARAQAIGVAAILYNEAGQYALAASFADRMLEESPDKRIVCRSAYLRLGSQYRAGKPPSLRTYDEAAAQCDQASEPIFAGFIRGYAASILLDAKQPDAALSLLRAGYAKVAATHYPRLVSHFDALLAQANWDGGNVAQTRAFALAAIRNSIRKEYTQPLIQGYRLLYEVEKKQGHAVAALQYHEKYAEADKGYLDEVSAKALAYQLVRQQVQAKKAEVGALARKNQILQLQQALDRKEVEASRLYIAVLVLGLLAIGLWLLRLKRSQLKFMRLAQCDSLTGIYNRKHFMSEAEYSLRYVQRSDRGACLILIDLDHFKLINDTHGHAMGDQVLRSAVAACQEHVRSTDVFGRLGGEEFGVMLPECGLDGGIERAELIRRAVAMVSDQAEPGIPVSASFGVAFTGESGYDLRQLLMDADHALYRAKRAGRNCVVAGKQGEGVVVA